MSSLFKSVARIAAPIVGFAVGGPAGAALASGATTKLTGGSWGDSLLSAGTSALTTGPLVNAGKSFIGSAPTEILWDTGGKSIVGGSGFLGGQAAGQGFGSAVMSGLKSAGSNIANSVKDIASGTVGTGSTVKGLLPLASNAYSAISGTDAYDDIAKAQEKMTQKAIDAQTPFLTSGTIANQRLQSLLGLGDEDQDDILETLRNSPGYQFRLNEGMGALNRSLAARSKVFSGEALRESQELGQGIADQTYNDYLNQLIKQSAAGQAAAGDMGDLYQDVGNIQGNEIAGKNNVVNDALSSILNGSFDGFQIGENTNAKKKRIIGYDLQNNPIYG
jgi:hypothetical protein